MPIDGSNNFFKGGGAVNQRPSGPGKPEGTGKKTGDQTAEPNSPGTPQGKLATKGLSASKVLTANPVPANQPLQSNTKTTKAILPWQNLLGGTKTPGLALGHPLAAAEHGAEGEGLGKEGFKAGLAHEGKPPEVRQTSRPAIQRHELPQTGEQRIEKKSGGGFLNFLNDFLGGGDWGQERDRILEELRSRGLSGFAGLVWYDREKKRPSSFLASLIVNGIIILTILLLLTLA